MTTFCPASMCPLFAKDGSPWTGQVNAPCAGREPEYDEATGQYERDGGCAWYHGKAGCGHCMGAASAMEQVADVEKRGAVFQLGPVQMRRERAAPRTFDCPRSSDCQWQHESGERLCPPRHALSLGIDPKACAY